MSRPDYDPRSFPAFAVTVDIVVLTVHEVLSVLVRLCEGSRTPSEIRGGTGWAWATPT